MIYALIPLLVVFLLVLFVGAGIAGGMTSCDASPPKDRRHD